MEGGRNGMDGSLRKTVFLVDTKNWPSILNRHSEVNKIDKKKSPTSTVKSQELTNAREGLEVCKRTIS